MENRRDPFAVDYNKPTYMLDEQVQASTTNEEYNELYSKTWMGKVIPNSDVGYTDNEPHLGVILNNFIHFLYDLMMISEKHYGCIFGGAARDLVFKERMTDIDIQFGHVINVSPFIEELREKYEVTQLKRVKKSQENSDYVRGTFTRPVYVDKFTVKVGDRTYKIDTVALPTIRSMGRSVRNVYTYDFSVNMLAIVNLRDVDRHKFIDARFCLTCNNPYWIFKIDWAKDALSDRGFAFNNESNPCFTGGTLPILMPSIMVHLSKRTMNRNDKVFVPSHKIEIYDEFLMERYY